MLLKPILARANASKLLAMVLLLSLAASFSPVGTAAFDERSVSLTITGVEKELYRNVIAHLELSEVASQKHRVSERAARRLYDRSVGEIELALQAYGYYEPKIQRQFTALEQWQVSITISPGPRTRLRNVSIALYGQGRENKDLAALIDRSLLRQGAPLRHGDYSDFKSGLEQAAYRMGYLDVRYNAQKITVYPSIRAADIALHLDTGPLYYFGPITVNQDVLDPDYIARYVDAQEGDPFENASLVKLQLALNETNYFDSVRTDVQRDQAVDQRIPVTVTTIPRKRSAYEFSAGYGTDTGPRVGVQADFRRVNRQGHRFRNQAELSAVRSTLISQYVVPVDEVSSEYVDFSATVEQEDFNDVDSVQYRLGTSINENRWRGRSRIAIEYVAENWSFGDQPSDSARLLIPSLEFTQKQSNNAFFPTRGYSYTGRILGAADSVLADVTFAQIQLFAKAVLPVTPSSRVLLRGEFFATETDDFQALPPSLRFYAGGAQSVRGYGYKDLSPKDSAGNLTGGQYLATVSAEFDYLVSDNLGFAAFVDAGDATDRPFESFKVGAGLGLRYRSPVGMLRLDVAHPFDDEDSDYRFHISFGIDL